MIVGRGNLAANQAMIATAFGHGAATRVVTWLPLFHDMGLVGTVLQAIWLGCEFGGDVALCVPAEAGALAARDF